MANLSIKDLPDKIHRQLKKAAEAEGRSLNGYIIHILELDAAERTRRERMREGRREFLKFVESLPDTRDLSTRLLREDHKAH
jgi:plasmid stability protein